MSTSMRQRLRSALVEGKARYLGVGALLVASLLLLAYVQHINSQQSGPAIGAASDPQTFDTIVPSTAQLWPQHWMMKRGENPENWTVLAAADTHLWTMTASPLSEGKVHFEGYWADYSNAGGLLFRHGSLSGTGTWLRVGEMAVALEMDNLLDGSHREEALLLRPSATQPRETEYLQKLDHANYLPALIFGEVAPRHLPWLGNLRQTWWDGVFKILPAARAAQPLADIGALDAAVWNYSRSRPPDWVSPTKPSNFSLSALYDDRFLLLSCTLPSQTQFVTAQLTLFCSIDAETHRSPRWEATIRSDAIVNSAYVSRGGPLPWSCSWQAWSQQNGESSRITLRIPFESLAETTPPSNGNFWRVNWVIRGGDTVDAPAVARWGNEDLAQIDRAIVLEFE